MNGHRWNLRREWAAFQSRSGAWFRRSRALFSSLPLPRWARGLETEVKAVLTRLPGSFYPLLLALMAGVLSAGVIVSVFLLYATCGFEGCPDVRQLVAWQPGGAPVLVDRNGAHFGDLAPYERTIVVLDSLPEYVPAAFVAVEDRRFWRHRGVDWVRVIGAATVNVRSRSLAQGSSTISMQLARNVFPREIPGTERTFRRKIREVRVARLIEGRFDKADILEMYLNHIYFGGGAYGIEAASRLYFDKPAGELSVAEAATLAALPKAPSHYDPRRQLIRSRERRNLILRLMEREGAVTEDVARVARESEVVVQDGGGPGAPFAGYYMDVVRDLLEEEFGAQLYTKRLRIHTTLDRTIQAAAEEELESQLRALEDGGPPGESAIQGAAVFMDARTGAVLAMVGGRSPATSRYNRATLGRRQLGSAFKPFVFAAAIQEGIPTSRVLTDLPFRMELSRNDVWIPANYDGRFEGQISLREALVRSRNVPTVRLASSVGVGRVAELARAAGLDAPMDVTPSLALGTVATSPLQVATAYTTFATLGYTASPHFVVRVEDEEGEILWEPAATPPKATMDPRVAYIVTDILGDVVDRGTGAGVRAAGYLDPAAGKTGTTNDATDTWFIGFTPDLVGAIWIGYDRPTSLGGTATGGGLAAPVWGRIMQRSQPPGQVSDGWSVPAGIVERVVDDQSGLILSEGCRARDGRTRTEIFLAEHLPPTTCPSDGFLAQVWTRIQGGAARILTPRRVDLIP